MSGHDLISRKTRTEFREFLVGWTLREIKDEFESEGLAASSNYQPTVGGERRGYVEQFYHGIDFADPLAVAKLLVVYENILTVCQNRLNNPKSYPVDASALKTSFDNLLAWLRKDGYQFADGRLVSTNRATTLRHLQATVANFDAEYLTGQVQRLEAAVTSDPDLAIGQAKELVETCCKTILHEHGTNDADKLDVQPLVRRVMEELKLVPDGVTDAVKGAKTVKAVLGNLATVAQGLAELRNLYGTGHGKHGKAKGLSPRHARLAVGAATTLVTFLLETHQARAMALPALGVGK
jgi:hypothetical protein